jgi:hypothetical protein
MAAVPSQNPSLPSSLPPPGKQHGPLTLGLLQLRCMYNLRTAFQEIQQDLDPLAKGGAAEQRTDVQQKMPVGLHKVHRCWVHGGSTQPCQRTGL